MSKSSNKLMKASVLIRPGEVKIEKRAIPAIEPDKVLIKVELCGICGTELLVYEGKFPVEFPYYNLGHEYTGKVVEIGSQVKGISVGDRVLINPNYHCDSCYFCHRGEIEFCENRRAYRTKSNGGFAEYALVTEKLIYGIPESISVEEAIFAEPLSCCVHGVDMIDIEPGAAVVILGCGTMGLLTLQLCKLRGAGKIIASDPVELRRDAASRLGADIVVNPMEEDLSKVTREAATYGPGVVIECAGARETIQEALELVGKKGQVLLLAIWPKNEQIALSPSLMVDKEISIKGSVFGSLTMGRAIELLRAKKIETGYLLTHRYNLDNLNEAIKVARNRESIKVAVSLSDSVQRELGYEYLFERTSSRCR